MVARDIYGSLEAEAEPRPAVNTHVHLPPNFSAFETVAEAVESASAQGLAVIGSSNYHDFNVYREFGEAAGRAGILPLFGVEIISMIDELEAAGTLVNDPGNPGRTYLCGKGLAGFDSPNAVAAGLMAGMRGASEERMRQMTARMEERCAAAGLPTGLTDDSIAMEVAHRAAVPVAWVSLQERHVARAFQDSIFRSVPIARRPDFFERLYGSPSTAGIDDAVAVQEEIRSKLMKAGRAAFVPEASVSFEDARRLVLELGGVPCYPTLADGASPICAFEDPAEALAERLLERNVYIAELIPGRNSRSVVDRYVEAFRQAGIVVMAGTEHNTPRMIPLPPACMGGEAFSDAAELAFWEGTCIVVAHQHLVMSGERGFVDREGRLSGDFPDHDARRRWFAELGASLIEAKAAAVLSRGGNSRSRAAASLGRGATPLSREAASGGQS